MCSLFLSQKFDNDIFLALWGSTGEFFDNMQYQWGLEVVGGCNSLIHKFKS